MLRLSPVFLVFPLLASPAMPQANYAETFDAVGSVLAGADGPTGLISAGWAFSNQSSPLGSSGWSAGGSTFTPYEGAGYLETDGFATDFFGGDVSLWAVVPPVANQVAGDVLTVQVRRLASSSTDRLQLRYSPSGGADTGSGSGDFGDFTVLLHEETLQAGGWVPLSIAVPGPGRLALRYVVENACNFGCFTSRIGIDALSVGPPIGPGCNLPPLPTSGQTVVWTAAGSPWEVCADLTIPSGSTVIVEPGATVDVEPGSRIVVNGTLIADGTPTAPVSLLGNPLIGPALHVFGTVDLRFVVSNTRVQAAHGGSVLVADSSFSGGGPSVFDTGGIATDTSIGGQDRGTYVQVDRTAFASANVYVTDGTLAISDADLNDGGVSILRGYLFARDVTIDGSSLSMIRERFAQPTLLDDLEVRNSPVAGLTLNGWNYEIGPGTILLGNVLPVRVSGGLLPGSSVPSAGNLANHVALGDPVLGDLVHGPSSLGALDVPYVVSGGYTESSDIEIESGATIQFSPGSSVIFFGDADIRARGRAGAPIRIEGTQPGANWNTLKFQSNTGTAHFEHCEFEGGSTALLSDNSWVDVDACTFRNNTNAIWTSTGGFLKSRKTRYLQNAVGAHRESGLIDLDGGTGTNALVGNGLAVEGSIPATNNWWGDPSGPSHPSNPGGSGDSATVSALVVPFSPTAPNLADAPPHVQVARPSGLQESGGKLLLSWESEDDFAIAEQRILFSEHAAFQFDLVATLPSGARSYEFSVPVVPPSNLLEPSILRVVAVDESGQEGWDEVAISIPYVEDLPPASLTFTSDLTGPFTFGDRHDLSWDAAGLLGTYSISLAADVDGGSVPYGAQAQGIAMPYVSTNRARFLVQYNLGAGSRYRVFLSDPFTVRPDSRLPDAPPAITITSPAAGSSFEGGTSLPIRWTASDDEAVRAVRLFASFDGEQTWDEIAEVDGAATEYFWQLPTTSSLQSVSLRAAAIDKRHQSTATEVPIAITAATSGRFCIASTNSAGRAGRIAPTGTTGITANDFGLRAVGLPPSVVGLFFAGTQTTQVPFGDGYRCVAGQVFRLSPTISNGQGVLSRSVDLESFPASTLFVDGSTWHFQGWYRDTAAGQSGFNLTDAQTVTFVP